MMMKPPKSPGDDPLTKGREDPRRVYRAGEEPPELRAMLIEGLEKLIAETAPEDPV
jgi:hypothetical protein